MIESVTQARVGRHLAASTGPSAEFRTDVVDSGAAHAPAPFLAQPPTAGTVQPVIRTINTSTTGAVMLQYEPALPGFLDGKSWSLFFYNTVSNASVYGIELLPGAYQAGPSYLALQLIIAARHLSADLVPQVNSTLNDYHFLHDCTGHARPFEVSFAGSQLTMLNGNLGYMSFTNCDQLYVHGPVDLDFATSQLPITQVS